MAHGTELQTDLTADETEYLITELEGCRKKAKILEEETTQKRAYHLHWFAKPGVS